MDLRIEFLDELSQFDQFVSINFPPHLHVLDDDRLPACFSELRGIEAPPSAWLAQLIITEVMGVSVYEKRTKTLAMGLLRDMLVRLSYDERYQSPRHAQRVALLFLPILQHALREAERLTEFAVDAIYRKELMSMFLFLVQTLPEKQFRRYLGTLFEDSILCSEFSLASSSAKSCAEVKGAGKEDLTPLRLLQLGHLIVDTFDFPINRTSNSVEGNGAVYYTLSPLRLLKHIVFIAGCRTIIPTGAAVFDGSVLNNGFSSLAQLDQLMHVRNGMRSIVRKASRRAGGGEERKWKAHANNIVCSVDDRRIFRLFSCCDLSLTLSAAKGLTQESILLVLKIVLLILDHLPRHSSRILQKVQIPPDLKKVLALSVQLLLHCLHNSISNAALILTLRSMTKFIREFNGKLFLATVGDSLQDWIRIIIELLGCNSQLVRAEACSLLLQMLVAVFHSTGSTSVLSDTILSVFSDTVYGCLILKSVHSAERECLLIFLQESIDCILSHVASLFTLFNSPPYPAKWSEPLAYSVIALLEKLSKIVQATQYIFCLFYDVGGALRNHIEIRAISAAGKGDPLRRNTAPAGQHSPKLLLRSYSKEEDKELPGPAKTQIQNTFISVF